MASFSNFFMQCIVDLNDLPAHFHDWRRRAGIRSRRHGGDVRGKQNEKSGGGRARSGRSHKRGDGHRRLQNCLNDRAHRIVKSARRIDSDQDKARVIARRALNSVDEYSARIGSISPSMRRTTTFCEGERISRRRRSSASGKRQDMQSERHTRRKTDELVTGKSSRVRSIARESEGRVAIEKCAERHFFEGNSCSNVSMDFAS